MTASLGRTESTLGNLPVELLDKIATQLTRPKDLRAFASTSQFFRELARPSIDTLRSDPMRIFERNYYTTVSEKIRAYTSLAGKILSSKKVAKVAVAGAVVAAVAAVGGAVGGSGAGAIVGGAVGAAAGVVAGVAAEGAVVGVVIGGVVGAVVGGAGAVAAVISAVVGVSSAAEKVAHLWGEKRRYLEICQENRALRSLVRAVIREDLSFLPPAESFKAARIIYQSASPAKTPRFSRALVEQLVRSSSPLAELQRFLLPRFESKLNLLRENYNKLWKSEKRTFSLHSELSVMDGPSIALQDLVQGGRDLAEEIARNLSPQIVQIIDPNS